MPSAPISMSATIQIPEDGFDIDFLRQSLRKIKAPVTSKMLPCQVSDPMDVEGAAEDCIEIRWLVE